MTPSSPHSRRLPAFLAVGIVLAAGALVVALYQSRTEKARVEAQAAALKMKIGAAVAAAAPPTAKPEPQVKGAETAGAATAASATPAAPPADPSRDQASPDAQGAEGAAEMLKSPMMQKIMASQTAAVMQTTYARLMEKLDLTPEERDHLLNLLIEKQTNLQNLGMQMMNPALSADERTAILGQLRDAWISGEAKVKEFINDEADFAYYQNYNQQEPERKEIGMFESSLPKEMGLDASTADALATLQSESRKKFPFTVDFYNQQNFGNPGVLTTGSVRTFLDEQSKFQAQVADEAARLLNPTQLDLYKKNQAAVRQMSAMQLNTIVQLAGGGPK